jgi:hypothetical protein
MSPDSATYVLIWTLVIVGAESGLAGSARTGIPEKTRDMIIMVSAAEKINVLLNLLLNKCT